MLTIKNTVKFNFTKRGSEPGIEIFLGQGESFWSCGRGTDLYDFDTLLECCVPNIDFEQINYSIARWWEAELYRVLSVCKQQRSAIKALAGFCERITKKYTKKQSYPDGEIVVKKLIYQVSDGAWQRIFRAGNKKVSGRKSRGFPLKISA